jgi:hypothetical protein
MPTPAATPFEKWEFSPEEVLAAASFTDWNIKFIQNEISSHAQAMTQTEFNGADDLKAMREHTYHRGAMEALQWVLKMHEEATALLKAQAEEDAANQPKLPL